MRAEEKLQTLALAPWKTSLGQKLQHHLEEAHEAAGRHVDHPYLYHGSAEKIKVGAYLKPSDAYTGVGDLSKAETGKKNPLVFAAKEKRTAEEYAREGARRASFAKHGSPVAGKIPKSRHRGYIYTVADAGDWLNKDAKSSVQRMSYEPQKIIARESVKAPRYAVPVTRNELMAGAVGGAVIGGALAGAYYYRHHNGKVQRVHKGRQASAHMHRSMQP